MRITIFILFSIILCSCAESGIFGEERVDWESDFEKGLSRARDEQKLLLVDFSAEWCPVCSKMDKTTYSDKRIVTLLKQYVAVRINIENDQDLADEFDGNARKYGGSGVPTTLILDADGSEIFREHGFLSADKLLSLLESLKEEYS